MDKIIITGYKGFIGKNLYKTLEKEPHIDVNGIDDEYLYDPYWIDVIIDMLNNYKPSFIFHVGAITDTLETDVNKMMKWNFESTKIITDWCKYHDVPLVYSSSAAIYGTDNTSPSNLYGWSKYAAEQYVISNGGIALRYFNVYGPGEENKGNMSSVAYQSYVKKKNNKDVYLFANFPKRDFIYVKDVVQSNIYAYLYFNNLKNKYYDVGTGEPRLFEDVLNLMEIDFKYPSKTNFPNGYQFYTCSDKLKWMMGWKPQYTLDDGIKEYKKYLDENYSNR